MTTKKTQKKSPVGGQSKTLSYYEKEADKFVPSDLGAGTLLRAKRDIENVLNLKNLTPETFNEGDTSFVVYELVHKENGERALIMLKNETRVMHITSEFNLDYEVVFEGTSEMFWQEPEPDEEE
jgi:hypothetical protein